MCNIEELLRWDGVMDRNLWLSELMLLLLLDRHLLVDRYLLVNGDLLMDGDLWHRNLLMLLLVNLLVLLLV